MKAQVDPFKVIIAFIIVAVVAGLVIFIFQGQLSKQKDITDEQLAGLKDTDGDKIVNLFDKCPDTDKSEINQVDSSGCSPGDLRKNG